MIIRARSLIAQVDHHPIQAIDRLLTVSRLLLCRPAVSCHHTDSLCADPDNHRLPRLRCAQSWVVFYPETQRSGNGDLHIRAIALLNGSSYDVSLSDKLRYKCGLRLLENLLRRADLF